MFADGCRKTRNDLKGVCAKHVHSCNLPSGCHADMLGQVYTAPELVNDTQSAPRGVDSKRS